jgi:plasmid stability protein
VTPTPDTGTLYLRGMPRKLVREAKVEAARRGMSLTAFAREALARALGAPAGTEASPAEPGGLEAIQRDLDWFEANRARLLRRYRDEYVAVIDRKVVDHDPDFGALAERVFRKHGMRSIAMPKVTAEQRVAEIPSPWREAR